MPQETIPDKKPSGASNGAGTSVDAEKNGGGELRRVPSTLPVPQFRKRGPTIKKPHIRRPVAPPRANPSAGDASADPGDGLEMYENVGGQNRVPADEEQVDVTISGDN